MQGGRIRLYEVRNGMEGLAGTIEDMEVGQELIVSAESAKDLADARAQVGRVAKAHGLRFTTEEAEEIVTAIELKDRATPEEPWTERKTTVHRQSFVMLSSLRFGADEKHLALAS